MPCQREPESVPVVTAHGPGEAQPAWAELLRRVFAVDVLRCDRCGGRRRLIATVMRPSAVRAILAGAEALHARQRAAREGIPLDHLSPKPDAPIDVYAADQAYWESFWHRPVRKRSG